MLFGLACGPENVTQLVVEVQPLAGLPEASTAVMVSLNATPTVMLPVVFVVGGAMRVGQTSVLYLDTCGLPGRYEGEAP